MIEPGRGDLIKSRVEALVNPVNTVGLMDNGPSREFKSAFPDNFNAFRGECVAGRVKVGQVFVFELGTALPRYILNVATKAHSRSSTTLAYVDAGLVDLVAHVKRLKIQSLAMPAIGNDFGGPPWRLLRPRIEAAFAPLPDVQVLLFAPNGPPGR
ncbi:ADP-ribose 1-phosphate phophatase related protein [Minicystis rosea]|nr:ADP-ribose 1-phosphate phophatase related protein [Minicystis rosea]